MKHYDLVVIGAGSGNVLVGPEFAEWRTAVVEQDRFGGTCLNRGCIPSKMFVVAADAATGVGAAARLGVHARLDHVDWPAIRDRVFGRIDPLHESAVRYRRDTGTDVYTEPARFVAPRVLEVGGETITADTMVVATGSRPVVPPIPGLSDVAFHTSDTIMRIDGVPESLVVIGGGFIAAELGHVFGAFGSRVTIVQQGPRLLMAEDEQVSQRFTEIVAQRHRLLLGHRAQAVEARPGGVAVQVAADGGTGPTETVEAAALLVATGRRSNADLLDATAGGLDLDEHGHIAADASFRTSVPGVWTLGDATNHFQLKHRANAEVRVVRHNILHPDDLITASAAPVPHAVFADPQIASVGLTEQEARARGIRHVVSVRDYADTAYGWALEDTTSFVKLLADPRERLLLGAHVIGPMAATLIQPLLQALACGQTVDRIARDVVYIHPALTEVVEQALLAL
ncbi:mycothione reductase [Pseudonocardia sp. WMMC193]|uniref:mycothione reductase n=1 Tax=Pseudonocardia sp. WMMC193 TaxID=2911965 RepID=UPI001F3816C0|nr:mycothione reductase [Pseudonocardia sp. WMMC193]MCF7552306.1 mycothione reductase [Pseudonocardia sp. WMMC193]